VELQSQEERSEYASSICKDDCFTLEEINGTIGDLRSIDVKLKPKTIQWMMKWTLDKNSAISMTAFVVKTVLFLRKRIAKQAFHKENVGRGKPGFKSSYEMFFKGTKYSCLLEMTWAGHQIITQAKNKPGMMDDSSPGEAENEHRKTNTDFSSSIIGLQDKSEILIKQNKGIKRPQQQLSPNRSVIPKILPKVMTSQNGHLEEVSVLVQEQQKSSKVD
jgi:hypothetical protein